MKITTILEIQWEGFSEVFALDDSDKVGVAIKTSEKWPKIWGGFEIEYHAEITHRPQDGLNTVHLKYERLKQPKPDVFKGKKDVRWGTWEITWRTSDLRGKAIWRDEDPRDAVRGEKPGTVKVLQWRRNVSAERARRSAQVIDRPGQSKLRDYLLRTDKCCAISGQRDQDTLDVAHIIEAKLLDYDVTDNAFLLRADLHRLFDKKLIRFKVHRGIVTFECSPKLSRNYQDLLKKAKLDQKVFSRIASAIAVRSALKLKPTKLDL
jgi:hypothetical protein